MPARSPFLPMATRRIAMVPTVEAMTTRGLEIIDDLGEPPATPFGWHRAIGYAVREVVPPDFECLFLVATTGGLADREVAFEDVDALTPAAVASQVVSEVVMEALAEHVRRRKGGQ